MKDEIVLFETAKIAKEKGLMIDVNEYYVNRYFDEDRCCFCTPIGWEAQRDPAKDKFIYAPTQSILQKWLREKHKIVVIVDFYNNGEEWEHTEYQVKVSEFKHFKTHDSFVESEFKSYEEALEIGLQKALLLIDII